MMSQKCAVPEIQNHLLTQVPDPKEQEYFPFLVLFLFIRNIETQCQDSGG